MPEMKIKRDVPIILNSINYDDSYDMHLQIEAVIYSMNSHKRKHIYLYPTVNLHY